MQTSLSEIPLIAKSLFILSLLLVPWLGMCLKTQTVLMEAQDGKAAPVQNSHID